MFNFLKEVVAPEKIYGSLICSEARSAMDAGQGKKMVCYNFLIKIISKRMTGYYEASAQENARSFQDGLMASRASAGFARLNASAECGCPAPLIDERHQKYLKAKSSLSEILSLFERHGNRGQAVLKRSIRNSANEPDAL